MDDLIRRKDVLALSKDVTLKNGAKHRCVDTTEINLLPSAQVERKKGKWIKKMMVTETEKYISYDPEWYCSCCGAKYDSHIAKFVNFCYVCGADMRKEE